MVIVSKSEQRKIKQIEKIIQKSFIKKEVPSGIEICERQLFHLANNIKDTEINHEIDIYLPKINEVLEGFSKEELIKKVFSVEFTRFYNYYKKAKDLNVEGGKDTSGEDFSKKYSEDSTRYFINLGRKDGLQWMDLKDLIREITDLGKDDVFHVDTMETFSFFNTDSAHIDKVLEAFKGVQFNDRNVDIEISKDKGGRNRGGGKGGNRGKGKGHRKGGGGKRGKFNDDRPKFKGKSRRKESRPKEKGTGGKRRRRM